MALARDQYGLRLTAASAAAEAYNRGVDRLLNVREGALEAIAESLAHDPGFALGHAALALLGHEYDAPVDIEARLRNAKRLAVHATDRERSHVHAATCHVRGNGGPLIAHLERYPNDAMLLSVAVPTIAFAGVTTMPQDGWAIVERARPAYGEDPWFSGLLAFIRQEQCRWDEAMDLASRALSQQPAAGHAVHARTHVHYETGDHIAGLAWLDGWIGTYGGQAENLAHYSWHAALHELSLGDLPAIRARYERELRPPAVTGCRALVDSASLLWRWSISPYDDRVPAVDEVISVVEPETLLEPPTPFMALHSAVALCADHDLAGLRRLERWSRRQDMPAFAEVVSPLASALAALVDGRPSKAADALQALRPRVVQVGGSDAQREVIEDTLIAALLASGRLDEARALLDDRLDRRDAPRDLTWRARSVSRP